MKNKNKVRSLISSMNTQADPYRKPIKTDFALGLSFSALSTEALERFVKPNIKPKQSLLTYVGYFFLWVIMTCATMVNMPVVFLTSDKRKEQFCLPQITRGYDE